MSQYFNLTLDTTAPGGGVISGLQSYYNSNATVNISAIGASYMKVWANATATGATSDANYPSSWVPYSSSKAVTFTAQGTQYVHAQFMDSVGNMSTIVNSSSTIYDTVAPTISNISINNNEGYTKNTTNTVRVTFSDATSGVTTVTLDGDIVSNQKKAYTVTAAEQSQGYKNLTISFAAPDGIKTVTATVTDAAGNTSSASSDTIMYDTTAAEIKVVLRDSKNENNLPTYVTSTNSDYGVMVITKATDIASYKIWVGDTEPSSWESINNTNFVTPVSGDQGGYFIIPEHGGLGDDGPKTIHVKVQDMAGNITEATPMSIIYDTTPPAVTASTPTPNISQATGYDVIEIDFTATDTNSSAGLTCKLVIVSGGEHIINTPNQDGKFYVSYSTLESLGYITSSSAPNEQITFEVHVTDAAGNTGESLPVIVHIDTTAPIGQISATQDYFNTTTASVTVSANTAATGTAPISKMKVWLDDNEPSSWSNYSAGEKTFTDVSEGRHYAYAKFMTTAGVESLTYQTNFIVDTTAPTGTITGPTYTNTKTVTFTISASDEKPNIVTSGVDQMKVWEGSNESSASWERYVGASQEKTLQLSSGDGQKTVNVKFKDTAGNETANVTTCTIILDTDEPDVTLTLTKTDGTTTLPSRVNITDFNARIGFTKETQDSPIISYKLTGDFTGSADTWKTFTPDSGKSYMTISNLNFTTGDGLKTITALLMDEAGNISATGASFSVTYDSTAPVIDITTAPDYNIISKQHTSRLDSQGAVISGKYNDTCTFSWSANEKLQAFKVCVNEAGQTAAEATAIGTTHGSQNMSGGAIKANTDITSVIMGADFAATAVVNDEDGAYEIIVYGQDEGGTWSAVHVIS